MKKLFFIFIFILVGAIYTYTKLPTMINYDSDNVNFSGVKIIYKNELYTGKILKKIPLNDSYVTFDVKDGVPNILPNKIIIKEVFSIPVLDEKLLILENNDPYILKN